MVLDPGSEHMETPVGHARTADAQPKRHAYHRSTKIDDDGGQSQDDDIIVRSQRQQGGQHEEGDEQTLAALLAVPSGHQSDEGERAGHIDRNADVGK